MTDDRRAFWDNRYATSDYVYGTAPSQFLARCRPLLPPRGAALSVADGEGRNGVFLAECGLDVTSLDLSPNAQAKAGALATARGVALTTVTADLVAWEWPDAAFDVVAAIFFQFLTPDERDTVFAAIRRALKPGGLLLLHGYSTEQLRYGTGGPGRLENLYTPALLRAAFGDFTDLAITSYDAELDEGRHHLGRSALIDLTGRKPA